MVFYLILDAVMLQSADILERSRTLEGRLKAVTQKELLYKLAEERRQQEVADRELECRIQYTDAQV